MAKLKKKNEAEGKPLATIKEEYNENIDMIVAIINRGFSDYVVDAARSAGASGATIMYGRSSMKKEEMNAFINLQAEKEIVLILVKKEIRKKVMQEICDRTNLQEKGNGVCFCVPVNKVMGVSYFENEAKLEKKA